MKTTRLCPKCRQPLPENTPEGLCPACLAKAALESEPAPPEATVHINPSDMADAGTRVPPTPAQLAPYFPQLEIIELLGQGGMGVVYKARQPRLDRLVALKILPAESAARSSFAERFNREAKALARLNHPGIVAVYDFGQTGQYYYFVMEYVDGMNLRRLLSNHSVTPRQALELVAQICTALQYAHDEGVVHRDIKPENILLNKKGQVKIADFGLAKLLGGQPDTALTMSQATMGTLNYMAPEQRENAQKVDHRADIYSLGVVFYEMLTGEVPMGRFEPPSKRVRVDVRLDEVVLKALEREPERRYQHASEIKTDVRNVASAPNLAAAVVQGALLDPPTRGSWSAWVWWTLLVLVTLPFFYIGELNRGEALAGHGPKYFMAGPLTPVLLAIGALAIIKLLELRLAKADPTGAPFSQAWLGIIVAIFGACVIAIGPFPYVEWRHETLKMLPATVANASGERVELAGFSEVFVKHGYEFWEGRAIALISISSCALLLMLPRRLRWNVARSVMLLGAGVAIAVLAVEFEVHHELGLNSGITMVALEDQAKTDPVLRQFVEDFRHHKERQGVDKNVPPEAMEKLRDTYGGTALREHGDAPGWGVSACAALVLMMLGVNSFRRTTKSSPAAFAGWHQAMERWSSLLLLVPGLISVWLAIVGGWMEEIVYLPLLGGETWFGHWVKESRLYLVGVDFWQGKIVAATCIVAILVVVATVLQRWNRAVRAATLIVAGLVSMACAVQFVKSHVQDSVTVSWEDFHAVAQHGEKAARSAETRRFLSERKRYVGQLVELEKNVQALAAQLTNPATASTLNPETREAQARRLAQGGGVVGLYQSATPGPQLSLLCGFGLVLLGIRDGYRAWRQGGERADAKAAVESLAELQPPT